MPANIGRASELDGAVYTGNMRKSGRPDQHSHLSAMKKRTWLNLMTGEDLERC